MDTTFKLNNISTPQAIAAALAGLSVLVLYRRLTIKDDVPKLKGPARTHWLIGNYLEYNNAPPSSLILKWAREFGSAVRMHGMFGRNVMFISDPAAVSHVFGKNATNYDRSWESRTRVTAFWPNSVVTVRHENHMRHRRVLQPAFGPNTVKNANEMFQHTTGLLIEKLDNTLRNGPKTIEMGREIKYTTLDAIWLGGFGADLGSIKDPNDPNVAQYLGLAADDIRPASTYGQILARHVLFRTPDWMKKIFKTLDRRNIEAQILSRANGRDVGARMVKEKMQMITAGGDPGKDALSRLLRSNTDPEARWKFTNDELVGSIGMLHFAGHETTANAISWALHLLSNHQDVQTALRAEVQAAVRVSPNGLLSHQELDALPVLSGVTKETVRLYPALAAILRQAYSADVIPLSEPLELKSGKTTTSIAVAKDQLVFINVAAINRDKTVYGEDADEFRPSRWADMSKKEKDGRIPTVYAGLMSFAAGPR